MRFENMTKLKAANRYRGDHFFSETAMRFFNSVVYPELYGGKYFITREIGPDKITRFTIREAQSDGHILTVGEFWAHCSKQDALFVIKDMLRGETEEKG